MRPVNLFSKEPLLTSVTRQAMYVRVTIAAMQKQEASHTVSVCCSLRHPACNVHVPYFIVVYGLSGSTIFFDIIS
jgi:hypothetical protein